MAVSKEYRARALEKLGQVTPVTDRAMFGGVGIYTAGLFFALIDDDRLYLKVDDTNRADYESRGMPPFMPGGEVSMGYFQLPEEVLEDPDELAVWVDQAVAVAERKRKKQP